MKHLLAGFVILALIAAVGIGAYFIFQFAADGFGSLDPQVATVTIAVLITLIVIANIIAGAVRYAKQKDAAYRLQAQRAVIYADFVKLWCELIHQTNTNSFASDHANHALAELNRSLVLWGSGHVLKAYASLDPWVKDGRRHDAELLATLQRILRQMRLDLGVSNRDLPEGALLGMLGDAAATKTQLNHSGSRSTPANTNQAVTAE